MLDINIINNKYAFLFNIKDYEPIVYSQGGSVTLFPRKVEAFSLNSPVGGFYKAVESNIRVDEETYSGLIVRGIIGYKKMSKLMEADLGTGCLFLSQIINGMLISAYQYRFPKKPNLITFERPGSINNFFYEMEDMAAYELRLYVDWKEDI